MKETHSKMHNNGELESDVLTAERSGQFDILQAKEAAYVWMAVQKKRVSFPCQDTSWSPVLEANGTGYVERFEGTRFHTLSVQWACSV